MIPKNSWFIVFKLFSPESSWIAITAHHNLIKSVIFPKIVDHIHLYLPSFSYRKLINSLWKCLGTFLNDFHQRFGYSLNNFFIRLKIIFSFVNKMCSFWAAKACKITDYYFFIHSFDYFAVTIIETYFKPFIYIHTYIYPYFLDTKESTSQ